MTTRSTEVIHAVWRRIRKPSRTTIARIRRSQAARMPGDQRTRSAGSWTAFYKKTVAIMLLAVVVSSAQAQPAADYIVTIKNHEVAVLDVKAVEQIAVADMRRMPDNRNDLRSFVLGFMREVAEHYHDNHAMFTIITDEYSSPLEYKAFVKRFTPKDVTAVIPPRKP